jgi:hypothetical protein
MEPFETVARHLVEQARALMAAPTKKGPAGPS